jgi:hypothetical protein
MTGLTVSDLSGTDPARSGPAKPTGAPQPAASPAASPPASASQDYPNPTLRLDSALGLVVIEFRDGGGTVTRSIPSAQQLQAYRQWTETGQGHDPLLSTTTADLKADAETAPPTAPAPTLPAPTSPGSPLPSPALPSPALPGPQATGADAPAPPPALPTAGADAVVARPPSGRPAA